MWLPNSLACCSDLMSSEGNSVLQAMHGLGLVRQANWEYAMQFLSTMPVYLIQFSLSSAIVNVFEW